MEYKDLRRVEFLIDEKNPFSGVKTISLVNQPAMDSDFIKFSKESETVKHSYVMLSGETKMKQVVAGLALIPNKEILRVDENGDPYIGYFSVSTIEMIRNKFQKELMNNMVNMDHLEDAYVNAYMIESFIIDSPERLADVNAKGIIGATLGSWFVAYKIEDKEIFDRVMAGELKGFSVEAYLDKVFSKINNNKLNKFTKMNKFFEKMKVLLSEFESENLEQAQLEDGSTVEFNAVGEPVNIIGVDSEGVPTSVSAPEGEHMLSDGRMIIVDGDGLLVSIVEAEAPAEEAPVEEAPVEEAPDEEEEDLMKDKEKMSTLEADIIDLNKVNEQLKSEKEKLSKEVADLKIKLSKLPASKPVSQVTVADKSKDKVDFSKMSTYERIATKNGLPIQ